MPGDLMIWGIIWPPAKCNSAHPGPTVDPIINHVFFQKCDILTNVSEIKQYLGRDSFDVCFDKGTYDAISLCPDDAINKRKIYIKNISEILGSLEIKRKFLILTSCNWTKEELVKQFQERT